MERAVTFKLVSMLTNNLTHCDFLNDRFIPWLPESIHSIRQINRQGCALVIILFFFLYRPCKALTTGIAHKSPDKFRRGYQYRSSDLIGQYLCFVAFHCALASGSRISCMIQYKA